MGQKKDVGRLHDQYGEREGEREDGRNRDWVKRGFGWGWRVGGGRGRGEWYRDRKRKCNFPLKLLTLVTKKEMCQIFSIINKHKNM